MPTDIQAQQGTWWHTAIILTSVMIFCITVSVLFLLPQSLRLDEAQSLWESGRSPSALLMIVAKDVHVPLYHLLLHEWRVAFGSSVAAARSLSLVFYLLSIPALYLLGRLAYSRTTGLYAAVLFGLSPFMNWYGSEIRMYTLFTLLVILNQYFFLRIIKKNDAAAWTGYAVTAMFGIYSHYLFWVSLLAQAVFYVFHQRIFPARALLRLSVVAGLLAAVFAPWVWYVYALKEAGMQLPLLARPTTVDLFNAFSQFLFGFQDDAINTIFVSLWPITVILAFLGLRRNGTSHYETEYLLFTLVLSFAALFVGSLLLTPIFVSRYLIFTVPSLCLLLAHFFERYPLTLARTAQWSIAMIMVAGLVIQIQNPATPVKENYQQVAAYINTNATPQDTVILSTPFTLYPIEYYYHSPATLVTLPIWNRYETGPIPAFSAQDLPTQVAEITNGYQEAWLVLSYDQGYEKTIKSYFDQHYQEISARHFSRGLDLYIYQLRYDTVSSAAR